MKKAALVLAILVLSVAPGLAKDPWPGSATEGLDELTKQNGLFKKTLIRPDADFSTYAKICPTQVILEFREQDPAQNRASTGSLIRKRSTPDPVPTGRDRQTLERIVNQALVSELERSDEFELVHDAGPGTLVVRAAVTDIVTDIASRSDNDGDDPFVAQGTIVFDLIDAETGVIQARVWERRKSPRGDVGAVSDHDDPRWAKIDHWAERAAADLRNELERVRSESSSS